MKRYRYDRVLGMLEYPEGEYVKHEDYQNQQEENIADNRNKLSPITTLISLLEHENISFENEKINEIYLSCLKQCKRSVNHLASREVYDLIKIIRSTDR